jgi:hypothetical protein
LDINAELAKVTDLCRTVRLADAEERMRGILTDLSPEELRASESLLRSTIQAAFFKKRAQALLKLLEERVTLPQKPAPPVAESPLTAPPGPKLVAPSSPEFPRLNDEDVRARVTEFELSLRKLSDSHIFQWSTYYRDRITEDFDWFLKAADRYTDYPDLLEQVNSRLRNHAVEIFQKGYDYQVAQSETRQYSLAKSIKGVQRFLDLPIEIYSTRLPAAITTNQARRLRQLTSCMISAILCGYADVDFGGESGSALLLQNARIWAHALPFFTGSDAHTLLQKLERNDLIRGIMVNMVPVIEALDELGNKRDHMPLPAVSQLLGSMGGLNVWLRPSVMSRLSQMIELQCYFSGASVSVFELAEAAERGVAVVVAPLRPELLVQVQRDERLRAIVVSTNGGDATEIPQTRRSIIERLLPRAYRQGIASVRSQPLRTNFARAFPLDQPELLRFFRVRRQSVRDLLRTFEARSGVRLWCSVRRSGKTTAGSDLGTTTGDATVVNQTCDSTGESPNDGVLYKEILTALESPRQLSDTFFKEGVRRCADSQAEERARYILVLDEYETLFGRLRVELNHNYDVRYTVVQPLLNQMVHFARNNLLIFMGQQPNAHYVLMDQNQLAPHVRQDHFPLFQHEIGEPHEEFAQLIQKIVTSQLEPEPSFVGAIFAETAGHPFLTVNLLADFIDWIIDAGRTLSQPRLTGEDFKAFGETRLRPAYISTCREYHLFREATDEATGDYARSRTPWLHAVYSCMSEIARSSPATLSCSRADFSEMVTKISENRGLDPDRLLSSAAESNFFSYDERTVWPTVRLLGRIAAVSVGRVGA